jgi:hypothetical protein
MTFLYQISELANGDALNTLERLSPWAYVIVILTLAISGVFLRLYITEKNEKAELEKEFRTFMANSLSKQIDVSKDVIQLVTRNKDEVKDALSTFTTSDAKIEALIAEVKSQLERVESAIIRINF